MNYFLTNEVSIVSMEKPAEANGSGAGKIAMANVWRGLAPGILWKI